MLGKLWTVTHGRGDPAETVRGQTPTAFPTASGVCPPSTTRCTWPLDRKASEAHSYERPFGSPKVRQSFSNFSLPRAEPNGQPIETSQLVIEAADAGSRSRNSLLCVGFDARALFVRLSKAPLGFRYDLAIGKARLCSALGVLKGRHAGWNNLSAAVVAYELMQRMFVQPVKDINQLGQIAFALGKCISVFYSERADQRVSVFLSDGTALVATIDCWGHYRADLVSVSALARVRAQQPRGQALSLNRWCMALCGSSDLFHIGLKEPDNKKEAPPSRS